MRVKPHAVLAETVNAARHLGKPMFTRLINGVLRRFQREQQVLLNQVDEKIPAQLSMPQWLLNELLTGWPEHWRAIVLAMQKPPPLTLRVNNQRIKTAAYMQKLLQDQQSQAVSVAGLASAVTLSEAVPVKKIAGFSEGLVSVQDAGAQLAAEILNAAAGSDVLDACSAPGGKTGHILERSDNIRLTAIDVDSARLQMVADNLDRLALQATLETGDAAAPDGTWATRQYDYILLDVPCSATGVIRRHPDIKLLRRKSDIAGLLQQQRRILENVWPLLKVNGRLLYATCSLLPVENEQQIAWFLQQYQDAGELSVNPQVGHHKRQHGIQVIPGDADMDGFYYALLSKQDHG